MYALTQDFVKLLTYIQNEKSELEMADMADEVIPFFARNQYKEQLRKMNEEA